MERPSSTCGPLLSSISRRESRSLGESQQDSVGILIASASGIGDFTPTSSCYCLLLTATVEANLSVFRSRTTFHVLSFPTRFHQNIKQASEERRPDNDATSGLALSFCRSSRKLEHKACDRSQILKLEMPLTLSLYEVDVVPCFMDAWE